MNKKNIGQDTLEVMSSANNYNAWSLSLFSKYLKGDILEIGGGIGNFTSLLTKYGDVTSIEIEKSYLPKIRKRVKENVDVGFGDIEKGDYFFKRKKFDSIVILNVLEHIKDDDRAVANIFKLLKKKGHVCILVPAHSLLFSKMDKNLGHYKRYTKDNLNKLLIKNGFDIKETRYLNLLGAFGWFFSGRVLKKEAIPQNQLQVFDVLSKPMLYIERFVRPPFGLSVLTIATKK